MTTVRNGILSLKEALTSSAKHIRITRSVTTELVLFGVSPSGKALGFDLSIPRFES